MHFTVVYYLPKCIDIKNQYRKLDASMLPFSSLCFTWWKKFFENINALLIYNANDTYRLRNSDPRSWNTSIQLSWRKIQISTWCAKIWKHLQRGKFSICHRAVNTADWRRLRNILYGVFLFDSLSGDSSVGDLSKDCILFFFDKIFGRFRLNLYAALLHSSILDLIEDTP